MAFSGLAHRAAPEIVRRLRAAPIAIRRVVDAGCGAGPLSAALVEAGFAVTGIDASAELLALARAAAPGAQFVQGSVYETELQACEAILAVGEPLTYHAEGTDADAVLKRFFERAAEALPRGGILIFDLIEPGEPSLAGRFCASGEDWAVLVETAESGRSLIRAIETFRRVDRLYRRGREIHRVRLFNTRAVCRQLAACGFATETARSYGAEPLPPRRRAFFCSSTKNVQRV